MRITPGILVATYEFLRHTPPFWTWKLPEADEVEFHTMRKWWFGDHVLDGDTHIIRISENSISHTYPLVRTMAHEMIHVYHGMRGLKTVHGADFKRDVAKVCRAHGFDPKEL